MIENDLIAPHRGIRNAETLAAIRAVPREVFVPFEFQARAYGDHPIPIGMDQTISQPFIVAYMTEALQLQPTDRVLEIGTGSGYQTAVLAELVDTVYTIERLEPLARASQRQLADLGYRNIEFRTGDGGQGWPEAAPFDAILVTCAPESVPHALRDQLQPGGRLVIPFGKRSQVLTRITHRGDAWHEETLMNVRFVPMVPDP